MKFLPVENITYKTRLKETEIVDRLSGIIEPEKTFSIRIFGTDSTKSYEGEINDLTFSIRRIISYKNSFLPRINGVIHRDFDGTAIQVKMRLSIFVLVFIIIWSSIVGLGCLAVLTPLIADGIFDATIIIPFGMLIFMYALTMGAFKYESNKSKKDLQTLFEAEIMENS